MNLSVKVNRKPVEKLVAATFPGYRGRTIRIEFTEKVMVYDLNWDGGTNNSYRQIDASGFSPDLSVMNSPAPWNNDYEGKTIDLTPEMIVVKRSYFCGHDVGITIYAHPVYAPKWLPAGDQK
jgi:hypothetical protein